jgi:hypothetical protein
MLRAVVAALLLLAGCVPATVRDETFGQGVALAPTPVVARGQTFTGTVGPGPDGTVLTSAGAIRVPGAQVTVSGALTQSDGVLAKEAAVAACQAAGGAMNPMPLGRFAGQGTWVFDGVCG